MTEQTAARAEFGAPYSAAVDGLRTIAVTGVLYAHFYSTYSFAGHAGVRLFFVISGYLISFILISLVAASSAITRDVAVARFALGASVLSTWAFTVVFVTSLATGAPAGWLLAVLLASISAKDLTMLRNPVRVPTEDTYGVDDPLPHERTRSAH